MGNHITSLDDLVKSGELQTYDRYRGMGGDDFLYLVFSSGRELHVRASMIGGDATLRVEQSEELSWEGLSARDFYAYLATVGKSSRDRAKKAFLEWYYTKKPERT